jgi:murein L,D-transpeptidase YcbB/YkuD
VRGRLLVALLAAGAALSSAGRAQEPDSMALDAAMREPGARLDAALARPGVAVGHASLRTLYAASGQRPVWIANGRPTAQAVAAVALLADADARGLRPADYDAAALGSELAALVATAAPLDAARLARFDLSLSREMLRLVAHLHAGRVDPQALRFELPETHRRSDLDALVLAASRSSDPAAAIAVAEPRYAGYVALRATLARYRLLAGDSTLRLPPFPRTSIRPGETSGIVPALARFLAAVGDFRPLSDSGVAAADARYGPELVAAVEAFQRRHSLEADGVIGPATARELRIPLAQRVRQIELTLERWRWLPDTPPERYAVVNIPGFRLVVFEHDSTASHPALAMSVIVGQAAGKRGTPVFTGTMDEVVIRPFWDVPLSIARKELVPQIRRDPASFASEGFEIVRGTADDAGSYAPTPANLDRVVAGTLRLRQRPGPINALGFLKFVFPNSHNVYLHDTPARDLFARTRRDFSHGCIRIADPLALAELVLRDQDGWNRETISTAMYGDSTIHVHVANPVAVYIVYATAVAAADGAASFYPDLYGHDRALERALSASVRPAE